MDIEERYEDISHQFLVSSQDSVSMETGITLMLFHRIIICHLSGAAYSVLLKTVLKENEIILKMTY